MRIKRYFAADIKQAIRMVREELGPDAVILSNRKVDGGVEIVAARDFDEQNLMESGKQGADSISLAPAQRGRTEARRRTDDTFEAAMGAAYRGIKPDPVETGSGPGPGSSASGRFSRSSPMPATGRVRHPGIGDGPQEAPVSSGGGTRHRTDAVFRHSEGGAGDRFMEGVGSSTDDTWIERNGFVDNPLRQRRTDTTPDPRQTSAKTVNRSASLSQAQSILESRARLLLQEGQDQFVRVIQQELRLMRNMLDGHLGETGWQQAANRSPLRMELLRRFSHMGFSKRLTLDLIRHVSHSIDTDTDIINDAEQQTQQSGECHQCAIDVDTAIEDVGKLLGKLLPLVQEDLLETGGIVALVGPTGVGKTTTIAKLAARFRMKHGPREIALVTTDNYRIGAYEQLTTYGRILDVPVRIASGLDELHQHLDTFYDRKLVLIDTAGMGPRDFRLMEQINLFKRVSIPIKSCLVLSAASQLRTMQEAMDAFQGFSPDSCILTKIDEAAQAGVSLSVVIENRLPVAFICDGQQVPEDLHHARKAMILNWCLRYDETQDTETHRPFSYEDWIIHTNV